MSGVGRRSARMQSDADRLRFAVRFATESLRTQRALSRVRRELADFLGVTRQGTEPPGGFGIRVVALGGSNPCQEIPKNEVLQLQREARWFLQGAVESHGGEPVSSRPVSLRHVSVDVVGDQTGRRIPRVGGAVRTVFFLALILLLAGGQGRSVLRCPECGTIFYRVRRQKYCNPTCTDRAGWRRYPEEKKIAARQKEYDKHTWRLGARGGKTVWTVGAQSRRPDGGSPRQSRSSG